MNVTGIARQPCLTKGGERGTKSAGFANERTGLIGRCIGVEHHRGGLNCSEAKRAHDPLPYRPCAVPVWLSMNDTSGMVLAAMHAQTLGAARVAIVDWDAHHGNGTQDEFYDDPSVLTISIHQDGRLPRASGSLAENGSGTGVGANINVPLPPGSGKAPTWRRWPM